MSGLKKATLQTVGADPNDPRPGPALEVQFNPTSLKLQMANSIDGAKSRGRQVQQYQGTSSTVLTLDLVFDTADEGTTDKPRSVRDKTREVARFVLPARGSKQVPPRVRFTWGSFVVDGVMTSMIEDIDLFSADGVPLRAKASISINEQDARFANLAAGPGANQGTNATPAGQPPVGPGSSGPRQTNRTALALGGESAADFAARVGLDPAGWRGIAQGLEGSLSLEAGAQIDFSADMSVSAGIGISTGIEADASASAEVALGLVPDSAAASRGRGATAQAGFALSAAGGVAAAAATATTARAARAAADARQAFGGPPPAAIPTDAHAKRPATLAVAANGPQTPLIDLRAASFGFGIPLRPRVGSAVAERAVQVLGSRRVRPQTEPSGSPVTRDPTVPGWVALPLADRTRRVANRAQDQRRPLRRCGCAPVPAGGGRCRTCGGAT